MRNLPAAMLHRPSILFLDEPTIGLDAPSKLAVREFVKTLNREQRRDRDSDHPRHARHRGARRAGDRHRQRRHPGRHALRVAAHRGADRAAAVRSTSSATRPSSCIPGVDGSAAARAIRSSCRSIRATSRVPQLIGRISAEYDVGRYPRRAAAHRGSDRSLLRSSRRDRGVMRGARGRISRSSGCGSC